jgi:hypothetical protein
MMSDATKTPANTEVSDVTCFLVPISLILESNDIGDKATMAPSLVKVCAKDSEGNFLVSAEVGFRRFFMTFSPALKGRLVGEDRIEDEEVRIHFNTNIIGDPLK